MARIAFALPAPPNSNGFNRDIRADRIAPLTQWVRLNFPGRDTSRVVPWAGLRPMMPNMMPVVRAGRKRGVFYNTGHGHLGWTLSAATAQAVAQAVDGHDAGSPVSTGSDRASRGWQTV